MNISFFAKSPRIVRRRSSGGLHLYSGSSLIRGEQIAEYLGAKYNPVDGYENDICIYVKPRELDSIKKGSYVDIVDGRGLVRRLRNNLGVKIIASSQSSYNFLKKRLKNDIIFIPQHHCNFERFVRCRQEINTVGAIGARSMFHYSADEMKKQLEKIGLNFITNFSYTTREEVVDFYKQIDIQVAWSIKNDNYKNPLKIVNSASFGIPTVAYRQIGYKDFEGNYIAVESIDSFIAEAKKLKDKEYYNQWAAKIIKPAEKYHISKIAELYKQLL